jgi:hypothetical protein
MVRRRGPTLAQKITSARCDPSPPQSGGLVNPSTQSRIDRGNEVAGPGSRRHVAAVLEVVATTSAWSRCRLDHSLMAVVGRHHRHHGHPPAPRARTYQHAVIIKILSTNPGVASPTRCTREAFERLASLQVDVARLRNRWAASFQCRLGRWPLGRGRTRLRRVLLNIGAAKSRRTILHPEC